MANNLQSTAKQGVGFGLVVDGREQTAKLTNPGTLNTPRPELDTSHTGLTGNKTSIPDELADPLEMTLDVQFDATLQDLLDAQTGAGANTEREIYLVFPKKPDAVGVTTEHGHMFLPAGRLTSDGINIDISSIMGMQLKVSSGNEEPVITLQATAVAPADLTFTQSSPAATAAVDGQLLGTLSSTYDGVQVFVKQDALTSYRIDGKYVYAVGAQSSDITMDITVFNWVGYREGSATTYKFNNAALVLDLAV